MQQKYSQYRIRLNWYCFLGNTLTVNKMIQTIPLKSVCIICIPILCRGICLTFSQLRVQNTHMQPLDMLIIWLDTVCIFLKGKYIIDLSYFRVCWFHGRVQRACVQTCMLGTNFVFHRSICVSCGLAFTVQKDIKECVLGVCVGARVIGNRWWHIWLCLGLVCGGRLLETRRRALLFNLGRFPRSTSG